MNDPTRCRLATVLLVEDNPGDVRLTKEAFKEGRVKNDLHVVTDGNAALEFLRQEGSYSDAPVPDVVLLDLNLPGKNGDEVLEELKSDPELRHLPVVVMTSSRAEEDVVRSYDRHANAFLTKPVDPDEFVKLIQTFENFWLSIVTLPPEEDE